MFTTKRKMQKQFNAIKKALESEVYEMYAILATTPVFADTEHEYPDIATEPAMRKLEGANSVLQMFAENYGLSFKPTPLAAIEQAYHHNTRNFSYNANLVPEHLIKEKSYANLFNSNKS